MTETSVDKVRQCVDRTGDTSVSPFLKKNELSGRTSSSLAAVKRSTAAHLCSSRAHTVTGQKQARGHQRGLTAARQAATNVLKGGEKQYAMTRRKSSKIKAFV